MTADLIARLKAAERGSRELDAEPLARCIALLRALERIER